MALTDDLLKGNPIAMIGLGALTLAVPLVFPALRPVWAAAVKSGAKLFFEAELGADGEMMDRLVDMTVQGLLLVISEGGADERKCAADAELEAFKAVAHARARKHGWNAHDRKARYHRSMSKLHHAVAHARRHRSGESRAALDHIADRLEQERQSAAAGTAARDESRTGTGAALPR